MAKKHKIAYWLLPAAALCLVGAAMSVGESQARYDNSAVWHTVAEPNQLTVTSNLLARTNQPPQTVLLGQMALDPHEVSFVLDSSAGVSGALTWAVDKPEYMEVAVKAEAVSLSSGDTVSLEGNTPVTVTMTLTPTAKAAQPREAVDVNIQVGWSDALAGTFRVELPPVEEGAPAAHTEPEATAEEMEKVDVFYRDETQPEPTQPETTEPIDTEPENTEPQAEFALKGFDTYHPELMFPVEISSGTNMHTTLKVLTAEGSKSFPQGTRFSLDNGENWFVLYYESEIPLDVTAGNPLTVMLDLSATSFATEPTLTITAGENTSVTLTANTEQVFWMSSQVLTKNTEIIVSFADLWEDCELVCSVDMLTATENGKEYVPAEISPSALMAEITQGDGKQQLSIRVGDDLPQPGTYRLNLSWHFNGACIWQTQTGFFINYTGNLITTQTGGDRQ